MTNRVKIGVLDYGLGNLHSVAKALGDGGERVLVSNQKEELERCRLLVVPGVGSFGAAMKNLSGRKLTSFVVGWIREDRPFLGICLGLQILFESSQENPGVKGLGVFPGRVVRFKPRDLNPGAKQIPHMGWNNAILQRKTKTNYFKGISEKDYFYFVHSFYAVPQDPELTLTKTFYGKSFCSAVSKGRLLATQFHPEKSGDKGRLLLQNVIKATAQ